MKQLIAAAVITAALTGCSDIDEKAAGIKAFVDACKGPVGSRLTVSTDGNQLELTCADFKPEDKAKAEEQQG